MLAKFRALLLIWTWIIKCHSSYKQYVEVMLLDRSNRSLKIILQEYQCCVVAECARDAGDKSSSDNWLPGGGIDLKLRFRSLAASVATCEDLRKKIVVNS